MALPEIAAGTRALERGLRERSFGVPRLPTIGASCAERCSSTAYARPVRGLMQVALLQVELFRSRACPLYWEARDDPPRCSSGSTRRTGRRRPVLEKGRTA
jgi:hypothetical protein